MNILAGYEEIPRKIKVSNFVLTYSMIGVVRERNDLGLHWYIHMRGDGKYVVMNNNCGLGDDTYIREATDADIQAFGLIDQLKEYSNE
jgi:hypothetical protein